MTAAKSTVNRNSAPGSLKSQNPFVQYIKRTKCTYRIGAMKRNFFSVSRLKNFRCPIISPPKGHFSIISTEKFLLQTATTLQRLLFFFFLRAVHTFTVVYNGHFLLSPRWLKEVRQLCSIITSQDTNSKNISSISYGFIPI